MGTEPSSHRPLAALWLSITGFLGISVAAQAQCPPLPLRFKITAVDPKYGMSFDDARALVSSAESWWEASSGVDLFTYEPGGATLQISFVFSPSGAFGRASSLESP